MITPHDNPSSLAWMIILVLMGGSVILTILVFVVLMLAGVIGPGGGATGAVP